MDLTLSRTVLLKILAIAYLVPFACYVKAQNSDSLVKKAVDNQDTLASIKYYEQGKSVFSTSMDSALNYFIIGANIAEELDFINGKILNWRSQGAVLGRQGKYDEALEVLHNGLAMIEKENLPVINRIDFMINIGAAHHFAGFTGKAIESYIEAVELCRKNGFDDKRSMLLNNLGIFYRTLNRHNEAIAIYEEALTIRQSNKDTLGIASVKHNIGSAFYKIGEYEKALDNFEESRNLYVYLDSPKDLLINQIGVGEVLTAMGKYEEVIRSLAPLVHNKNLSGIDHTTKYNLFSNLSKCYLSHGKFKQSLKVLDQIEPMLDSSDLAPQRIDFSLLKANTLTSLNRHAEANVYLQDHIKLSKEYFNEQGQKLLKEMETKYLSSEKDYKITSLNANNEIQNLQIEQKNRQLQFFGVGMLLLTMALYGFLLAYRTKMKSNKALNDKNKQLMEALDNNKLLVKEIHHRVKNNLQVVSSLLNLQSRFEQDDTVLQAINTGKYRVQSMSLLHQSLYLNEDLNSIFIKKYFEDLAKSIVKGYPLFGKEVKLLLDIEDIQLDVDTVVPLGLISNELITNSLKYAYDDVEDCELIFSIKVSDGAIRLIIKDNGKGVNFIELPEKSTTMGMQLIKSFANKIKAKVDIDNFKGTEFKLTFKRNIYKSTLKVVKNAAS